MQNNTWYRIGALIVLLLLPIAIKAEILYFKWNTPTERENGDVLAVKDILLYELQGHDAEGKIIYTKLIHSGQARSILVNIPDPALIDHYRIGVADRRGLYSLFVPIMPSEITEDTVTTPGSATAPKLIR